MVTLKIGRDGQVFQVHRDLLTAQSAYFQRVVYANRRRDECEPIVCLFSAVTFEYFMKWLYYGEITLYEFYHGPCGDGVWEHELSAMYCLGEIIESPSFLNFCMEEMISFMAVQLGWDRIDRNVVERVYESTSKGSRLRNFIVDALLHRRHTRRQEFWENGDSWQAIMAAIPDLAFDVSCILSRSVTTPHPQWMYRYKHAYLVEDDGLKDRWCEQIVAARSIEQIKRAASKGCRRSKLEYDQLKRNLWTCRNCRSVALGTDVYTYKCPGSASFE